MHRTYTLLVMASIVASAPTQASGSCLSYGHSCWGAHGKRSGGGQDSGRWILSKLAPISLGGGKQAQARLAQLLLAQQQARDEEGTSPEVAARDEASDQVLLMEQPPRLYQILNSLPRALDDKTPARK